MTRWKKILCACVAVAALVSPGALPSVHRGECQAQHAGHYRYYYIYYRSCPHDSWHYYGATVYPAQATQAIWALQSRGYETYCY